MFLILTGTVVFDTVRRFAEGLSQTEPSRALQTYDWMVPTIQSVHIVAIGAVLASVLMIVLRIFGWAWRDQTLAQTHARFGPWLSWGLVLLLVTGIGMVIAYDYVWGSWSKALKG